MKILYSLLIVFLSTSCDSQQKSIDKSKTAVTKEKMSEIKQTDKVSNIGKHYQTSSITYQAISRGFFRHISISNGNISVSDDRNLKNMTTVKCNSEDLNQIKIMLNDLEKVSLQKIEPPSKKHTFDGAPHATLTIRNGDVEKFTPTFDHGNPPKEISELVNKLLSMANMDKK
ncbi:hypothetical protein BTO05_09275 [Winogradskyella sp. PC-19]|jgi:hypothetical protein|uniref:hypothetical protein n=1 Tax=unclassified Winogradskyella TaxID=2615021 RepID=UPI000B3D3146|nr:MULTISPECIES: hypothetical protein [unclassified Winogradskyella]ARV09824.1 hypothetical protein BTO05_09275 [Winogradskyella sp. PC-19]RZN75666.1 MAG: hypothetical protein EVB12_07045 [Winogradskyella sp.]